MAHAWWIGVTGPGLVVVALAAAPLAAGAQATQPGGRQIQAGNGDIVIVDNDDRVDIVRRRQARVRVVSNEEQRTVVVLADWSPPGSTEPDGRVDRTWRFTEVDGRWPLDSRWDGQVTLLMSDGPAAAMRPVLALDTPSGLVSFLGGPARPDPPELGIVIRFRGMTGGGREGATFDDAERDAYSPGFMTSISSMQLNGPGSFVGAGGAGAMVGFSSANGGPPAQWSAASPGVTSRPMPRLLHNVRPEWPQAARDAGVRGVVLVEMMVAADGSVSDARVVRGVPLLDAAALDAVRQWRFEPAGVEGRPDPLRFDDAGVHSDAHAAALSGLVVAVAALLQALSTGTIRGTVVEARTGQPLADVLVQVDATGQQAISAADGRFEILAVPGGPHTLLVSVVGYGLARREVTVRAGEASEVTLAIAEGASTYVESVVVGAPAFRDADAGVASQAVLGSRDLQALRGVIADDPFRAVQALPEVATGDDFSAEFAVRGLGPAHTGIAVDGVDTPLLFHTVRGVNDTGSLALINTDVLDSATLVAGAYPQRAGAHLGARLDFTTRDGARDRVRARSMLGVTAVTGVFEGPIGPSREGADGAPATARGSWMVALRKSYLDWLLRQIDSEIEGAFGFTDGQATASWDLTPAQSIRATLISGRSTYLENDATPGPNTLDRATNRSLIANLQWRYAASPRVLWQQQAYLVDAAFRNAVLDGRTREEGTDRELTWRGSAAVTVREGHSFDAGGQITWNESWRKANVYTLNSARTYLDAAGTWGGGGTWLHYKWAPSAAFQVLPGVRADWTGRTGSHAVSPYVLGEWQVAPRWRVRASAGRQHQFATFDQTVQGFAPSTGLDPERAWTLDGGVTWQPASSWRVRVDGYMRREHDRLRYEDSEYRRSGVIIVPPTAPQWANTMDGEAAGSVITVERRQTNGLSGWVSIGLGRTELTDTSTREQFVSDYDQRTTLNAYGIYRTSRRVSLSARYRYGSNFPLDGYYAPVTDDVWTLAEQRNQSRLPAYSRLDLRADWAFTYRRSRLTLYTEVVNTLNRDNLGPESPTIRLPSGIVTGLTRTLFPILPSVGVLIEF